MRDIITKRGLFSIKNGGLRGIHSDVISYIDDVCDRVVDDEATTEVSEAEREVTLVAHVQRAVLSSFRTELPEDAPRLDRFVAKYCHLRMTGGDDGHALTMWTEFQNMQLVSTESRRKDPPAVTTVDPALLPADWWTCDDKSKLATLVGHARELYAIHIQHNHSRRDAALAETAKEEAEARKLNATVVNRQKLFEQECHERKTRLRWEQQQRRQQAGGDGGGASKRPKRSAATTTNNNGPPDFVYLWRSEAVDAYRFLPCVEEPVHPAATTSP